MKKRTHWWLVVWKGSESPYVHNIFNTRKDARAWRYRRQHIGCHTTAPYPSKVIKVVEAGSVESLSSYTNNKGPFVKTVVTTS